MVGVAKSRIVQNTLLLQYHVLFDMADYWDKMVIFEEEDTRDSFIFQKLFSSIKIPLQLHLFAHWEHMPLTKKRHCCLSEAILFISLGISHLLFLFQGGSMWWVMISGGFLSMYRIHLHFLFFINFFWLVVWSISRV